MLHYKNVDLVSASGVSIAISVYQFLLVLNLLERLARLTPGMRGFSNMALIIAAAVGELAFIYTRYTSYRKSARQGRMIRSLLGVTLIQLYILVLFVPVRIIALAKAFNIPITTNVFSSGSTRDTILFAIAVVAAGITLSLYGSAQRPKLA